MTGLLLQRLVTPQLVLEPLPPDQAQRILAGDLGGLCPAAGWPHDDTHAALRMAVHRPEPQIWLVLRDGSVIGDCGTHGPADAAGTIEIGYGLGQPWRGRGLGTELVGATTTWLLTQEGISRVVAHTVPANRPSQRVLEKSGFAMVGMDADGLLRYERKVA